MTYLAAVSSMMVLSWWVLSFAALLPGIYLASVSVARAVVRRTVRPLWLGVVYLGVPAISLYLIQLLLTHATPFYLGDYTQLIASWSVDTQPIRNPAWHWIEPALIILLTTAGSMVYWFMYRPLWNKKLIAKEPSHDDYAKHS